MAVIFASLGLGEAVYRLLFFDFDGATDRLPIEMMFGLAFAWIVMKLAKRIYQHRHVDLGEDQPGMGSELQNSSRRSGDSARAVSRPSAGDPGDSRRSGSHRMGAGRHSASITARRASFGDDASSRNFSIFHSLPDSRPSLVGRAASEVCSRRFRSARIAAKSCPAVTPGSTR